ncbi:extracellular solute-binding protein [Cellulosimicrobium marinum]|uniref:extracellular solute-binding protein n=1 Tax=Cellulosimicrobium marinum TaxID=1638992 RepID=UPI001E59EBD0|nr:extracellular solute-binding protein [Cellulosimicrobium marinum]MCB7136549.1 extracellular solute-binding protein [Cellulosimicrobium marinum]
MRRRTRPLAALAALAVLAPLAACGPGDSGTPVLTWYINPDAGGQAEIAARCTEEADGAYRVTTELLPRDAASQREQLARRLAAKDGSIDLMSLDPVFIAEFAEAGFLAPVPQDVADATTQDVVQGAIDASTWKEELVAIPFWANTQLLWYRKSVAEAAGLDMSGPVTWEQITQAAQDQDALLAVQGAKAESLTVWVNALVAGGGGQIIEDPEAPADELQLGLESEAGEAAAAIVGEIGTSGVGGPGLPSEDEPASLTLFQGDRGSFMVNWPFVWSSTATAVDDGSLDQGLLDDIGWALYPRTVEGEESRPPYGGISLGVGAFGAHPDLAYQATECIVSPENQAEYFVTNGNPASNTEAYEDPDVQEAFPMYDVIRESLDQAAPRPQTPFYNEVSTGIQQTWYPPSDVDPDTTPQQSTEFITAVLRGERLL